MAKRPLLFESFGSAFEFLGSLSELGLGSLLGLELLGLLEVLESLSELGLGLVLDALGSLLALDGLGLLLLLDELGSLFEVGGFELLLELESGLLLEGFGSLPLFPLLFPLLLFEFGSGLEFELSPPREKDYHERKHKVYSRKTNHSVATHP